MSRQTWGSVHERSIRLPMCGHTRKFLLSINDVADGVECSVCGRLQPYNYIMAVTIDCVPTKSLSWDGPTGRTERTLKAPKFCLHEELTLDNLVALLASHTGTPVDITGQRLQTSTRLRDTTTFVVWRADTHGCQVIGGTIILPPKGANMLLLAGRGVTFRGTTFRRTVYADTPAAIICAGADYSGCFEGCSFSGCSVYAVHGAVVAFSRCRVTLAIPGIVASGAGTSVTLRRCQIVECPTAIIVEGGAAVRAAACYVDSMYAGVCVNDSSSHFDVRDSVIKTQRTGVADWNGVGVTGVVLHEGSARLTRCGVRVCDWGLHARGTGPRVEVHESYIEGCGRSVDLDSEACALLRGVDVNDTMMRTRSDDSGAAAVFVGDGDPRWVRAKAQLERCLIQHHGHGGLGTCGRGLAALVLCMLSGDIAAVTVQDAASRVMLLCCEMHSSYMCARADKGGTLRADGCRMIGQGLPLSVSEGSAAVLVDTAVPCVPRTVSAAIMLENTSKVHLLRCRISDSGTGVLNMGGTAVLRDSHVSRSVACVFREGEDAMQNPGAALACESGTTTVTWGSVKGYSVGIVASVGDDSGGARASVRLRGVCFEGYTQAVKILDGCGVDIEGCEFWGSECGDAAARAVQPPCPPSLHAALTPAAVALCEAGWGTVRGCRFEGNQQSMAGTARGQLRVVGCSFLHSHEADPLALQDAPVCLGVPLSKVGGIGVRGPVEVSECRFMRVRAAVQLTGAGCAVRHCSFKSCEDAIVVHADCELTVSQCEFDRCARAMSAGLGVTLTVECCDSRGGGECVVALGGGGAVTATQLVAHGGTRGVRVFSWGGGDTAVKLEGCEFIGLTAGVELGGAGVTAELLRCRMSKCSVGLHVSAAVVACMRESQMHACTVAVVVGSLLRNKGEAGSQCWACGVACFGPGAVEAGMRGMREAGASAPGAWCCHEGGVARLAMADVAIHDCGTGVEVSMYGRMEAERLHLQACRISVALSQLGGQLHASFRSCQGCTLTACTHAPASVRLSPGDVWEPLELLPGFAEAEARSSWAPQHSKGAREE